MATVIFEERVEVPLGLEGLGDFRRWTSSAAFPPRGRIDFVAGTIEVDMSPEDVFCHGVLKAEVAAVLQRRVKRTSAGLLLVDSTRVVCPAADLSVEPDVVFVSRDAIREGRVVLVPKSSGEPGRYVELEGAPDLVVEIVSDTSVAKDSRRLPAAYHAAGVREYWLLDARRGAVAPPLFVIHARGTAGFEPVAVTAGAQHSAVMGCDYRLESRPGDLGGQDFDLIEC